MTTASALAVVPPPPPFPLRTPAERVALAHAAAPAYAPLIAKLQWGLYRLGDWDAERGKFSKRPVSPADPTQAVGPLDFTHSLQYVLDAIERNSDPRLIPGFVLMPGDPFMFFDDDTPGATFVPPLFNGCAGERSSSGRLHAIGTLPPGTLPAHSHRHKRHNQAGDVIEDWEFYSGAQGGARGIAITFERINEGSVSHVPDAAALSQFLQEKFQKGTGGKDARPWRDAVPPDQAFLNLVRFLGEYGERESALINNPSPNSEDDLRLARLVAHYVVSAVNSVDHGLIERNMRAMPCARTRANLTLLNVEQAKRNKWDDHKTYLRDTILKATASIVAASDVGFGRAMTLPAGASLTARQPSSMSARAPLMAGSSHLSGADQIQHFEGCTWIRSSNEVFFRGERYDQQRFDIAFGGKSFSLDASNAKVAKGAWEAFTKSQCVQFPKVDGYAFRPELEPGTRIEEEGRSLINMYWPVPTRCESGDSTPFLNHLHRLFPNERDMQIFLAFLAALVQHKGRKFGWAPLIQGAQGNGKTFFAVLMESIIGERYCHRPNANDLGNKFTGWLEGKLLIAVEEIKVGERIELMEQLKPLISNSRIEIQGKNKDQYTGDNRANFLMMSNHKTAIVVRDTDRRYAPLFCAQQSQEDLIRDGFIRQDGSDTGMMRALYAWLRGEDANGRPLAGVVPGYAIVHDFLAHYPIPDHLNPAGGAGRAPRTSFWSEAVEVSKGPIEQAIEESIDEERPGFRGGFVSTVMVGEMLKERGIRYVSPHKLAEILTGLGFVKHPALKMGQAQQNVMPDRRRPKLYVRPGSQAAALQRPSDVAHTYERTNRVPIPGIGVDVGPALGA